MSDDEHPELDFDPLDDTKTWPEDAFPLRPVGMMTLNRNIDNFFTENEQAAFGTGVLVDGLDFSDNKMLIGRTFAYSDTQRYRIGPNYLHLPVNARLQRPNTNLRDGSMASHVDGHGANPHVNYEPASLGGLRGADASYREYRPYVAGQALKATSDRQNNYQQAGERYRTIAQWERDDLITNLVDNLRQCDTHIQERMVWHFLQCDPEYGTRVAQGLGITLDTTRLVAAGH